MCFPSKPDTSSFLILVSLLLLSLTACWLYSASHGSIHSMGVHEVVLGRCVRSSSFIMPEINLRSSLEADLSPRSSRDISFSSRDDRTVAFTEFRPVQWEGYSVAEKNEKAACFTDLLSWFSWILISAVISFQWVTSHSVWNSHGPTKCLLCSYYSAAVWSFMASAVSVALSPVVKLLNRNSSPTLAWDTS